MNQLPNTTKLMLWKGQIDVANDTFKVILMDLGFEFDKDNHNGYADVSAWELPSGNGYTAGGAALTLDAAEVDDAQDRAEVTFLNAQWTASGGPLSTVGAIIYDDSTDTTSGDDVSKAIVAWIDAMGTQVTPDGAALTISNIMLTGEDIVSS